MQFYRPFLKVLCPANGTHTGMLTVPEALLDVWSSVIVLSTDLTTLHVAAEISLSK